MTKPQLIQPSGFHLRLSNDWLVSAISSNVGDFLPIPAEQALGQKVTVLLSDDMVHNVRNRMALLRSDDTVEHLLHVQLGSEGRNFDLSLFRDGDGFGIDVEPSDSHALGDATGIIEGMLDRIDAAQTSNSIASEAARQLRALTGYDRVVICGGERLLAHSTRRLDQPDPGVITTTSGEFAVADSACEPVAVVTRDHGPSSRSTLRMPDADEAAVLESVGARAALMVPLSRAGQHWGYVACYNSAPRHLGVERRSVAGLFAQIVALRLEIAELRAA